jgi:hypothetical protein
MYPWNNPFQPPPQQQGGSNLLQSILQQINQGDPQQKKNLPQYLQNLYQQWFERNKSLDQNVTDNAVKQQPPMGSPPGPSGDNTNSTQQQASAPPMDITPAGGGGPMQQQQMRQQASAPPMSVTPASVGQNYYGLYTYPGMFKDINPASVIPSGANPSYQ